MSTIVWFRRDLRVADNPALAAAARRGPILPVYVVDPALRPLGAAAHWRLTRSLLELGRRLGGLHVHRGDPARLLPDLARRYGADAVFWNRRYDPRGIEQDRRTRLAVRGAGMVAASHKGDVLFEPWEVTTGAGRPFKVFSPFWRAALALEVPCPVGSPEVEVRAPEAWRAELEAEAGGPERAAGWEALWQPGEIGARQRFDAFLNDGLNGYDAGRDRPDLAQVSRLSPALRFGELSPHWIWHRLDRHMRARPDLREDIRKFRSELGWREFAAHLLFHFPDIETRNWRPAFNAYPWRQNVPELAEWQRGRTGYPFADAGLRELWATGYMHNRVRMVAASFLVKHLRVHWRHGEAWFWDTLVDADPASNAVSWQWVAGSGADAAPYFRIFNPVSQGRKFDPDGTYVRRWCPELARLPPRYLHAPFEAPADILATAGVMLGETYPRPIIGHAEGRAAALAGYEAVRSASPP